MNKQQLANKIWESANQMRSKIEANEYKDYILGFIFYKYLCDKEVEFLRSEEYTDEDLKNLKEEDSEQKNYLIRNIGYFIAYENLFSTWLSMGKNFDVSNVRDALNAFSRLINTDYKKVFEGIFKTLETGLSKLGDSSGTQTKSIIALLNLIKDIPMSGKQDYDVLGFIYEYLISMFAANAGKKAGEFYTPHEVSLLMSEIVANHLKNKEEIKIYDPTSGSGSLLINIGKSVQKHIAKEHHIKYYAQELKENTYNLTRMNLIMRGIKPINIITRNADTLEDDWPYFDDNDKEGTYDPLFVDAVVSNPPYSQHWDSNGKQNDPRYARFGLAPKSKADYAFLLHDLYHLNPNGIMTIVLPHGVLFRGGEEGQIRKNLVDYHHIDAIIGLPSNIFFGTGIPTIIMVLKQKRQNDDILIIDASKGFIKDGKNNKLRASDIKKITDTIIARADIPNYSRKVSKEEIIKNDYNLNIPRYIDSQEKAENYDIYASMFGGIPLSEINELAPFWQQFKGLRADLFTGDEYLKINTKDIREFVSNHQDIANFKNAFQSKFNGFNQELQNSLIKNALNVNISKQKEVISDNIFDRLSTFLLIDKYQAYEIFHQNYLSIAQDLEIIQSEGFEATKKVDPNIIYKKDKGEVQEGFVGRIIPFALIHQTKLKTDYDNLNSQKELLESLPNQMSEIFENLSLDEKELLSDIINDDESSFINKEIPKKIKTLKDDEDYKETIYKLEDFYNLLNKEKSLKKFIKEAENLLATNTKKCIENLSDDEVNELLNIKWIDTLMLSLNKLPELIIDELINSLIKLDEKYANTLKDLQDDIDATSKELCDMIDELSGDDSDMAGLNALKALLKAN